MKKIQALYDILNNGKIQNYSYFSFSQKSKKIKTKRGELLDDSFQSGIIFFLPYFSKEITGGNISIYASVPDYHKVVHKILTPLVESLTQAYPGERFEIFTDSSPIDEVGTAVRAGLGVLGKHGLFIHKTYGSYGFLATIITTLQIPAQEQPVTWCINCQKCVQLCPTGAILPDGHIDREKCLSHITQKKGDLTQWEIAMIQKGNLLWGCDICQRVCPMNRKEEETYLQEFKEDILTTMTEETLQGSYYKTRAFGFRGKGVLRRNMALMQEKEKEK